MTSPRLEYFAAHTRSEFQARAIAVPRRRKVVIGPDGESLSLSDLPSTNAQKWGMRMKAQVVFAVEGGLISQIEACSRYAMSYEEYAGWKRCAVQRYHRADWARNICDAAVALTNVPPE
jgi:hypothetical protein